MVTEEMHRAAEFLRGHADNSEDAVVVSLVAAAFMASCKQSDAPMQERLIQACRDAAELLSPVCPHCHKPLRYDPQTPG